MNLSERAILVSLKIGLPTGTRRDKQATADVERIHNGTNLGRFNKDLINKQFFAAIKSVESAARAYLYSQTVPWGDDDSRLLSASRQMKFAAQMQVYGAAFDAETTVIIGKWHVIVAEAEGRLGPKLFDKRQYPDAATLPDKFKFRVSYAPVPTGSDLRVSLDDAQLKELRARIDEDTKAALSTTQGAAWGKLYEKVAHMAEVLSRDKTRIHESMVTNLTEVCDILPELNFTDDPRLTKAIALVKKNLIVDTDRLRDDPTVKESTAIAAKKIASAMEGWMVR